MREIYNKKLNKHWQLIQIRAVNANLVGDRFSWSWYILNRAGKTWKLASNVNRTSKNINENLVN